jgi:hypothetical protein
VAGNILLFFLQKEMKTKQKNNKILPATSACCGTVVRNECMNHFSYIYIVYMLTFTLQHDHKWIKYYKLINLCIFR